MVKYLITTPRLQLRPIAVSDLEHYATMYADGETMRYIGAGGAVTDRGLIALGLERRAREWEERGYGHCSVELHDGTFLGRCGLMHWDLDGADELEVGYIFARPHWGHGYATEAARAVRDFAVDLLGARRLVSLIYPGNVGSIRVAEKNGMMLERMTKVPFSGVSVCLFARNWTS